MTRLAALVVGAALLTWPALVNHYPILFSDTGGLLEMGLLPSMGWDKPFVYGPLIAALSLHLTLWLPLIAQGMLLSVCLWITQRALAPPTASHHLALCGILAVATAAPWFTATLMPDVFTPIAALSLIAAAAPLPRAASLSMIIVGALAITAHLSHLVLAAALIAALTLLHRHVPWRAVASLAAALVFLLLSNWIGHGRPSISPYGSVFALARLIADGPARDYLDRACPQAGWTLCAWRDQLTDDSDQFLWDAKSPFWADPMPLPEFAAQAGQIVLATIRNDPVRVLRDAYRNAAHQLARTDLGDTLGPDFLGDAVRPRIERFYPPAELERFDASRQANGTLAPLAARLRPLHRAALLAALAANAAILLSGLRKSSPRADLAALILIALAANALATGALSTVHDRYEARLAWLLLLPILLRLKLPQPQHPPATFARGPHSRAAASP